MQKLLNTSLSSTPHIIWLSYLNLKRLQLSNGYICIFNRMKIKIIYTCSPLTYSALDFEGKYKYVLFNIKTLRNLLEFSMAKKQKFIYYIRRNLYSICI